jgi:hypothetical protein
MAATETELVIFDCDGVLVDSEPISLAVLVESLAAAGVAMSEEEAHDRFLGRSLKSMSEILHDEYGLAVDAAFLEAMRKVLYERFRSELQPIDGIAETVDGLGIAHCVASSSQPERIRLSLSVTGLLDRQARARSLPACECCDGRRASPVRRRRGQSRRYCGGKISRNAGGCLHRWIPCAHAAPSRNPAWP